MGKPGVHSVNPRSIPHFILMLCNWGPIQKLFITFLGYLLSKHWSGVDIQCKKYLNLQVIYHLYLANIHDLWNSYNSSTMPVFWQSRHRCGRYEYSKSNDTLATKAKMFGQKTWHLWHRIGIYIGVKKVNKLRTLTTSGPQRDTSPELLKVWWKDVKGPPSFWDMQWKGKVHICKRKDEGRKNIPLVPKEYRTRLLQQKM